MLKEDYIKYWIDSSTRDLSSMEVNFLHGKYDWALFIGHLALEKLLKGLWVKNNKGDMPPKTHNLKKIADEAGYKLSEEESIFLLEINDFNIEAHYPDYKLEFYKKCTKEFAEKYLTKIKDLHQCILKQI